jgi:hypothetical protein
VVRSLALILGSLAVGTMVGCASSRMPTEPNATTCGTAYTFSAPGHAALQSGSCAGLIVAPAAVSIHVGQQISVHVMHEQDGRLDVPVPVPATAAIKIVSQSGASATYRAVSPGTVALLAHHTPFCATSDPKFATGAALTVHVEP